MPIKRARSSLSRMASVTAPKRISSSRCNSNATGTSATQLPIGNAPVQAVGRGESRVVVGEEPGDRGDDRRYRIDGGARHGSADADKARPLFVVANGFRDRAEAHLEQQVQQ